MSTVEKFQAAVDVIRGLPKQGSFQPSSDMQLKFYSFYKQATEGPCRNPKPSFWDVIGKAKWDAWKSLGSMPKEEAMEKYVDELKEVIEILKKQHGNGKTTLTKEQIVETMSYTDSVSKFLDLLGPFYESIPLDQSHPTVNGDHEQALVKPQAVPSSKGEKNDADNGHVNGFGEPGDLDSEGDEFSDTYDNIKEARGGSDQTMGSVNPRAGSSGSGGAGTNVTGRTQRNRLTREGASGHGGDRLLGAGGSGGSPGGSQHRVSNYSDVSDQLALAVIKLQHSMDDVNSRLVSLEMALSGKNIAQKSPQKKSASHLFGVSPQLLLLILAWPFLAHWIIYVIRKRSQR